ncbi:MAG TPA: TRAP transporter small permease [Bacillota bacterium]|nr:TRAP transporter small permease [Bacillota bacterium]
MQLVIKAIDKTTTFFGMLSGIAMVLGTLLVIAEIVARSVFSSTLYITQEYSGYLMVAITMFGIAYTLKENGHIRLTFLNKVFKGGKSKAFIDMYAFLCGFIIFAIITYATFKFFNGTFQAGTRSMQITKTYLAIPQFMLPFGSLLMTLQFLSEFLKTILKIKNKDYDDEEDEDSVELLGR